MVCSRTQTSSRGASQMKTHMRKKNNCEQTRLKQFLLQALSITLAQSPDRGWCYQNGGVVAEATGAERLQCASQNRYVVISEFPNGKGLGIEQ